MAKTLYLRLEAPLQSWGERSRWVDRDTAPIPTKSGVVGLIACAAGKSDDVTIRQWSLSTRMGVRIDAPGMEIQDFYTIGAGYEAGQGPLRQAEDGKLKSKNKLGHKWYLADASFLVALQPLLSVDWSLIDEMAAALQHPQWVIYLGRKCCPPGRPVYAGVGEYNDLETALAYGPWTDPALFPKPADPLLRAEIECARQDADAERQDVLTSRQFRTFERRYTRTVRIRLSTEETKEAADG